MILPEQGQSAGQYGEFCFVHGINFAVNVEVHARRENLNGFAALMAREGELEDAAHQQRQYVERKLPAGFVLNYYQIQKTVISGCLRTDGNTAAEDNKEENKEE